MNTHGATVNRGEIVSMYAGLNIIPSRVGQCVLSHVKTNNKLPPKYVEFDNARPTDNDPYAKS